MRILRKAERVWHESSRAPRFASTLRSTLRTRESVFCAVKCILHVQYCTVPPTSRYIQPVIGYGFKYVSKDQNGSSKYCSHFRNSKATRPVSHPSVSVNPYPLVLLPLKTIHSFETDVTVTPSVDPVGPTRCMGARDAKQHATHRYGT